MFSSLRAACFVVVAGLVSTAARDVAAQPPSPPTGRTTPAEATTPALARGRGVAVLAVGAAPEARDRAFDLARAIYGSRLRPSSLDEVRARVLAGGAPPANASRELRELSELRAGVTGDAAPARRLLSGIAQQVDAEALIVVSVERPLATTSEPPEQGPAPPADESKSSDAGATAGNAAPTVTVVARLFLAEAGEFDAARYAPEPGVRGAPAWKSTVISLEGRFPAEGRAAGPAAATRPPPGSLRPAEEGKSQPFYTSGWFWGALGAAALVGGAFYFASRGDTSSDTIHLQMRVPK